MATAPADIGRDRPLTIGAVCNRLQAEFPDISISKIRYLEDQGRLVTKLGDVRYVYTWSGERIFKVVSFYLLRYSRGRLGNIAAEQQIEVEEARFGMDEIHTLYESAAYPLKRRAAAPAAQEAVEPG